MCCEQAGHPCCQTEEGTPTVEWARGDHTLFIFSAEAYAKFPDREAAEAYAREHGHITTAEDARRLYGDAT